ncbi:somatostatin receptor type 1-like [Hemiscyllium ocellatum]|uniref:somatostatin receptor type 1-like n=1 Tax=Hemiscyllium ocellatum TaxID=170820 RepID=UPI0029664577|nr:somatostatin receptor type 1-like [Hemiscyllium ocellatum]XP_060687788.1 somatostatin receptor type 1-like [Hemiscyllium ocellatum]
MNLQLPAAPERASAGEHSGNESGAWATTGRPSNWSGGGWAQGAAGEDVRMVVIQFVYALVCLVGLAGNAMVIFVILRYAKMKTATNIYLLNLALADELFMLSVPFVAAAAALDRWPFGPLMCRAVLSVDGLNQFTSVFGLTVLSADRYVAVVHPIKAARYRRPSVARLVNLGVWLLSLLVILPIVVFAGTAPVGGDSAAGPGVNLGASPAGGSAGKVGINPGVDFRLSPGVNSSANPAVSLVINSSVGSSVNPSVSVGKDSSVNPSVSVGVGSGVNPSVGVGKESSVNPSVGVGSSVNPSVSVGVGSSVNPSVSVGKDSSVNPSVSVGVGSSVNPSVSVGVGSSVNPSVSVGKGSSVNPSVSVGKDSSVNPSVSVGKGSSVNPSVSVGKDSSVNPSVSVGVGSSVNPSVSVDKDSSVNPSVSVGVGSSVNPSVSVGVGSSVNVGVDPSVDSNGKVMCVFLWPQPAWSVAFVVYTFLLGFLLPVLAISLCYLLIILQTRAVALKAGWQQRRRSERKLTRLVLTVVAVFVVCWLPFYAVHLAGVFLAQRNTTINHLCVILSYANSCANPILYGFLSDNFRRSFQRILCFRWLENDTEEPVDYCSTALKSKVGSPLEFQPAENIASESVYRNGTCTSRTTTL